MSEPSAPYRIITSAYVEQELSALVARAAAAGKDRQVLDALEVIRERLPIYPQFGQPLMDLHHEQAQLWIGVIPPLVVRYAIFETRREVWIVVPIQALPGAGF